MALREEESGPLKTGAAVPGRRRGTAAGSVGPREEERAAEIRIFCGGPQGGGAEPPLFQ
jgi:hypothetical protein